MTPPIRFLFIELTSHCNFDCSFCPSGSMTRPRQFMDRALALRLLDEVAAKQLTAEPVQLHVMGEPLLHPHLFEILAFARDRGVAVRLFTNGALLGERNRGRLLESGVGELVIGVQAHSADAYREHRRGRPDYQTYLRNIRDTIEAAVASRSAMRIELHFMNTKHFTAFRTGKNYPATLLPLVDDNDTAFAIVDEWKAFGRGVARRHALNFEPIDLEGLQGPYRDDPLACVRGNHCEILPGVILSFKELGSFSDYLVAPIRFVERFASDCRAPNEQLAVLANGECTLCCVDYDGRMAVGSVAASSLESIWSSATVRQLQETNRGGLLPAEICRVCRAFQVVDDYRLKFPGREQDPYELERGWYPLERDAEGACRWMGKRAVLVPGTASGCLALAVKAADPRRSSMRVAVTQGALVRHYDLSGGEWTDLTFPLGDGGAGGNRVIVEADGFWVPAEIFPGNDDRRELSVRVRDVRVETSSRGGFSLRIFGRGR